LKFTFAMRGALLLFITVCLITVFCSGVTLTPAEAGAEPDGGAVDPDFGDGCDDVVGVALPGVPAFAVPGTLPDLSASGAGGGAPAVEPGTVLLVGEPPTPTGDVELAAGAGLLVAVGGVAGETPPAEGPLSTGTDCALPITVLNISAEITKAVLGSAFNLMTSPSADENKRNNTGEGVRSERQGWRAGVRLPPPINTRAANLSRRFAGFYLWGLIW
jgi:hypothetical protein